MMVRDIMYAGSAKTIRRRYGLKSIVGTLELEQAMVSLQLNPHQDGRPELQRPTRATITSLLPCSSVGQ